MSTSSLLFLSIIILTNNSSVSAEEFENQADAIKAVQSILTNPSARTLEANKTSEGKKAVEDVNKLNLSSEGSEKLYLLAGEVMTSIIQSSNGDFNKLNEIIKMAQENPEKFFNSWTNEQKLKLREIAKTIPRN